MENYINSKYVHSDLSGEIIGACQEVQNYCGLGRPEKIYQKALAVELRKRGINFEMEYAYNITYKGESLGQGRFDFLVEGKIIIELKVAPYPSKGDFEQIRNYLGMSGHKLGLLILFTYKGVKPYRIPNVEQS